MSAEPQNNDQPPKAVSAAQWLKQMGLGVPPLGSVVSCADCMRQVEVKAETWVLPRLDHSDAVVVCDACAGPHLASAAAASTTTADADPWSSAQKPGGIRASDVPPAAERSVQVRKPVEDMSFEEKLDALVRDAGTPRVTRSSLGTEVTLQGIIPFDADMQGSLRISTAEDVSRILQRLHQVVVAAEFLKTTPDGQPPALLTDALDFITGRGDHCVLVLQEREAGRPAAAEAPPVDGGAAERVEDKPS